MPRRTQGWPSRGEPLEEGVEVIEESRRRGESMVCLIDMLRLWTNMRSMTAGASAAASPIPAAGSGYVVFGYGVSDRAIRLRIAVPPETLRQLPAMAQMAAP